MADTKIITICNNKGGVGKTTCAAAIGDILARKLYKSVLLIDADPQANLSKRFGYNPIATKLDNSFDVYLQNELNVRCGAGGQTIPVNLFYNKGKMYSEKSSDNKEYNYLKLMCANRDLENAYSNFRAKPEYSNGLIRDMLGEIRNSNEFDYVIIDTQPVLSYVLGQYLLGTDYIVVPLTPNNDALDGAEAIGYVFNAAKRSKSQYKTDDQIEFLGCFFNMVKKGTIATREFIPKMKDTWGENPIFETEIPMNQDVNNAENIQAPVTIVKPYSAVSKALEALTKEMVDKIG